VGKKFTDLPLATVLNDADDFAIAQGGVSKRLPGSLLGGGGDPVFEWNGIDTTQFENVSAFFDALSGSAGALSVVASAEHGNVLRYSNPSGSQLTDVILAVDPLDFPDERRDFDIEIVTLGIFGTASSVAYGGAAILCDDSAANFHGIIDASVVNSNRSQCVINNGTVETTTASGSALARFASLSVRGDKPAAGPPRITTQQIGYTSSGNVQGGLRRTGSGSIARGSVLPYGDGATVLGSTWNPLACDRWGIGITTLSGGPPPDQWDILSIKIWIR